MQQFEYKTYSIPLKSGLFSKKQAINLESLEDDINLMGKKGWELVTHFAQQKNGFSQYAVLVFKRPLATSSQKPA